MPVPLETSQLTLLAGIMLLGWLLVRRQLRSRSTLRSLKRDDQAVLRKQSLRDKPGAVPLQDAPPETQRWLVEMHDLQRELKAELDTKIVVVQTLLRQADERIATLKREQQRTTASTPARP